MQVNTKGRVAAMNSAVLFIEAGADVDLKDKVSPVHAWIRVWSNELLCDCVCAIVWYAER